MRTLKTKVRNVHYKKALEISHKCRVGIHSSCCKMACTCECHPDGPVDLTKGFTDKL